MIKRTVTDFFCTEDAPIVQTKAGKLHGYRANGIYQFKGVTYAHAKRFQLPEPVAPWAGVKDALAYGPGSPEMNYSIRGKSEFDFLEIPGRIWPVSEDCQNLNIWTKSLDPGAKRPVMVWLHGGGFSGGSNTHLYAYEGFEMANLYDVVSVTVNHRLNMFGFLDLSGFGDKFAHSGNAGMADIVEALRWVRDNIASFGGDPENVTIYGQSGGGGKVTTLMQMPSADGLYHRAIIQSGVMGRKPATFVPKDLAALAVSKLGLTQETIGEIQTMDAEVVSQAVEAAIAEIGIEPSRRAWAPVPEEGYFAGHPLQAGFREESKHIPIIVGSCAAEFMVRLPEGDKSKWSADRKADALRAVYGDDADAVRAAFEAAYPELDWVYAADVDNVVRPAVIDFLNLRCQSGGAPCYNYIFEFETSLKGGKLLGHNSDLHFMFHNAHRLEAFWKPGVTERQQDAMAGAWAQFAYAGDPNGANLPVWTRYTPEEKACMKYCADSRTVFDHDRDLRALVVRAEAKDAAKEK